MKPLRYSAPECVLVVVDIQEKLLAKMPDAIGLIETAAYLLESAKCLGVPALITEQYPKGLGPTEPRLAEYFHPPIPAKTRFSAFGAEGMLERLQLLNRTAVVLIGMETHVCLAQTALDALELGFRVIVPVDAVASRYGADRDAGLQRLKLAGCELTTAEALVFEWLGDSAHPQFKTVSKLTVERRR